MQASAARLATANHAPLCFAQSGELVDPFPLVYTALVL